MHQKLQKSLKKVILSTDHHVANVIADDNVML